MSYITLEQILYELPPCIDDSHGTTFLHLQSWRDREGWNAFYGTVADDGWSVHPIYLAEGVNPVDACVHLLHILQLNRLTLVADPAGEQEIA